jgi:hypothetical protein
MEEVVDMTARPSALRLTSFSIALLLASPASAASRGDACAFRLATVHALFAAANEAGQGRAALDAGDRTSAASAFSAAERGLLAERKRIASEGGTHLAKGERRALAKALRGARKRARKAGRIAERRGENAVRRSADAAAEAIGAVLADAADAHAMQRCSAGEIAVARLFVGAGETRAVPAGSSIVAELGAEVLGTVVVKGASGGLALAALSGDVTLEGAIDARGSAREPTDAAAPAAASAERAARAAFETNEPGCGDGQPLSITAHAGDVRIGGTFFAYSGDGHGCPPAVVSSADALAFDETLLDAHLARRGGHGGDLIVAAPSGAIRFAPRRADDPGPFTTGEGGAGETVRFTDEFVPPRGATDVVRISAGRGGDSGKLALQAPEVALGSVRRLYGGGRGGDGGRFEWDLRAGEALFPAGLASLAVRGGIGGDGSVQGGRGGDLRYDGDRVVNAAEEAITEVTGTGGSGGNLHANAPRGPDDRLRAGDGGDAEVTGHRGWNGTAAHPDGAPGGRAHAGGGHGSIFDLPTHRNATGGDGGDARARGGRGGDGRPSCSDPPLAGGEGGAGGSVRALGGSGGTAPDGTGGDGGSALLAESGAPGHGGNGLPTGACGVVASDKEALPGRGGTGWILGAEGESVAAITTGCVDDFVTCDDVPPEPEPDACAFPRSFASRVVEYTTYGTTSSVTTDRRIDGVDCTGGGCGAHWTGSTTTTRTDANGSRSETSTFSQDVLSLIPNHPHLTYNFLDHCSPNGELHLAGSAGVDDFSTETRTHTVTHTCGGFCGCGSHWTACCPCETCVYGWRLDGDGVCE